MNQYPKDEVPSQSEELKIVAFLGLNVALALAMYKLPLLANAHNAITVLVGLSFAARKQFDRVVYAGAYIIGAEVVWRVSHATLSYESGKYSLVAVLGFGLWNMRWKAVKPILLYGVMLAPSTILTILDYSAEDARQQLSFHLAGPLALMVATLFMANIRLTRPQVQRTLVAMLGPVLGLAAITLFSTLTTVNISFTGESNFATSGGFGPNQVSSILGLGVFAAMFIALFSPCGRILRGVAIAALLICGVQSAMTFSRNGLYSAAGTALCLGAFGIKLPRVRMRFLGFGAIVAVLAVVVIFPRLNHFTGGKLEKRFTDTKATGRNELILDDVRIWQEHPVFGVGPGNAHRFRNLWGTHWSAHTEFSRLVAEHGLFGAGAVILLLSVSFNRFRKIRDAQTRALTASLFGWTFLYMAANAMRVAAPSFAFAMAFADFTPAPRRLIGIGAPSGKQRKSRTFAPMVQPSYAREINRTA